MKELGCHQHQFLAPAQKASVPLECRGRPWDPLPNLQCVVLEVDMDVPLTECIGVCPSIQRYAWGARGRRGGAAGGSAIVISEWVWGRAWRGGMEWKDGRS